MPDSRLLTWARFRYSNVVATGQIGDDADIHIWETTSSQTLSIIRGFHKTAVCALSFSSNGKLLLSVDASEDHGIAIYKWTTGMLMASSSGYSLTRALILNISQSFLSLMPPIMPSCPSLSHAD